jgi:hypothetical protein
LPRLVSCALPACLIDLRDVKPAMPFSLHSACLTALAEPTSDCSPSRGSRFNSAFRYVGSHHKRRLAIVVSDDRTVDIVPLLRPQINMSEIEKYIAELESASTDSYHTAQLWLDDHRFYLNEDQCSRVNSALERLDALPRDVGEIRYLTSRFQPDPELDDTYFLS